MRLPPSAHSHIEGHPHSLGDRIRSAASQAPSQRPTIWVASADICRKSLARRCRVPLVDKGCQGKVGRPAARRGEFDSREIRTGLKRRSSRLSATKASPAGRHLIGWRSNVNQVVKSGGEHIEVAKTAKQDRAQVYRYVERRVFTGPSPVFWFFPRSP